MSQRSPGNCYSIEAATHLLADQHYVVEEHIGTGGMACVYRARDKDGTNLYALKVLREEYRHDPRILEIFRREADTMHHFQHPNIVRFYRYVENARSPYIRMDYIDGLPLSEYIRRARQTGERFSLQQVMQIARQIGSAIDYLHRENQLHLDIKPGNILIQRHDEKAFLTDLGVTLEEGGKRQYIAGTPYYMPYEQQNGETVDRTADIYAFAVVLYEMLTNRRPFDVEFSADRSADRAQIKELHRVAEPVPPSQLREGLPPALDAVMSKALAKNRAQRYYAVKDFTDDLQACLPLTTSTPAIRAHTPAVATDAPSTVEMTTASPRRRGGRGYLPLVATLLLVALGVIGGGSILIGQAANGTEANTAAVLPVTDTSIPSATLTPRPSATAEAVAMLSEQDATPTPVETVVEPEPADQLIADEEPAAVKSTATEDAPTSPVPPTATDDVPASPIPPTATDDVPASPIPPTATDDVPASPVPPTVTDDVPASPVPPTATEIPSATPTDIPTATATDTPTATATDTPTATATDTATPTVTPSPTATDTPTPIPTEFLNNVPLLFLVSDSDAIGLDDDLTASLSYLHTEGQAFIPLRLGAVNGFSVRMTLGCDPENLEEYGIAYRVQDNDNYRLFSVDSARRMWGIYDVIDGERRLLVADAIDGDLPVTLHASGLDTFFRFDFDETLVQHQVGGWAQGSVALWLQPAPDAPAPRLNELRVGLTGDEAIIANQSPPTPVAPAVCQMDFLQVDVEALFATSDANANVNCAEYIDIYRRIERHLNNDVTRSRAQAVLDVGSFIYNICELEGHDALSFNNNFNDFLDWEQDMQHIIEEF